MADLKISALTSATTPLAGTEVLPIVQSSTTKKVSIDDVTAGRAVAAKNLTLTDNTTGEQFTINSSSSGGTSQSFRSTSTNGRNWRVGGNFVIGNGEFSIYDATSSVECFRINASDDIVAPNNNIVIGTSGKGIDFSATSGSGTSELLADYEEGTWSPTLEAESGSFGAITYNALNGGRYTKIGNVVHVQALLYTDSVAVGTASLEVRIGGLPFTAVASGGSTQNGFSSLAISQSSLWVVNQPTGALVRANSTQVGLFYRLTANGAATVMTVSEVTTASAGNVLRIAGTYVAA